MSDAPLNDSRLSDTNTRLQQQSSQRTKSHRRHSHLKLIQEKVPPCSHSKYGDRSSKNAVISVDSAVSPKPDSKPISMQVKPSRSIRVKEAQHFRLSNDPVKSQFYNLFRGQNTNLTIPKTPLIKRRKTSQINIKFVGCRAKTTSNLKPKFFKAEPTESVAQRQNKLLLSNKIENPVSTLTLEGKSADIFFQTLHQQVTPVMEKLKESTSKLRRFMSGFSRPVNTSKLKKCHSNDTQILNFFEGDSNQEGNSQSIKQFAKQFRDFHSTDAFQQIQNMILSYTTKQLINKSQAMLDEMRTRLDHFTVIRVLKNRQTMRKLLAVHQLSNKTVVLIEERLDSITEPLSQKVRFLKKLSKFCLPLKVFEVFTSQEHLYTVTQYCQNGGLLSYCLSKKLSIFQLRVLLVKFLKGIRELALGNVTIHNLKWNDVLIDRYGDPHFGNFTFEFVNENSSKLQNAQIPHKNAIYIPEANATAKLDLKERPVSKPLTTRNLGDLLHAFMHEKFFTMAIRNDAFKSTRHSLNTEENNWFNEGVYLSFMKVFYKGVMDLESAIDLALSHPFVAQISRESVSEYTVPSESGKLALARLYVNNLALKGIDRGFAKFCIESKKDNGILCGFRALLVGGLN